MVGLLLYDPIFQEIYVVQVLMGKMRMKRKFWKNNGENEDKGK